MPAVQFDCNMDTLLRYLKSCGLEINMRASFNSVVVQHGRRSTDWQIYMALKEPKPKKRASYEIDSA